MTTVPAVSVVIAAYNSSARLRCAVVSALEQAGVDLEVVVVGDACTDDSEQVLAALGDPRVRWENLGSNWGEQSVASNRGIALSRGGTIFFLNQDDLWRANHVRSCLDLLDSVGADVVWSPYLVIPTGRVPGVADGTALRVWGISPWHPRFDSYEFIPASCTAWRRSALDRLGGWRTAADVTVSPSQDLLWRAERAGLVIVGAERPTVLALYSGHRPGSFLPGYPGADNQAWLSAVREQPDLVDDEIKAGLVASAAAAARPDTLGRAIREQVRRLLRWGSVRVGVHPATLGIKLRYRRSGGFINAIRSASGLDRRDFRARMAKWQP